MELNLEVAHSTAWSLLKLDPSVTVTETKKSSWSVCHEEGVTFGEHTAVPAMAQVPVRHLLSTD